MYENAGASLKKFVRVLAIIEIVFCVFVGCILFFLGVLPLHTPIEEKIAFLFSVGGFLLAVVGSLFVWLKYLLIASFAELVEETKKSSNTLSEIKDHLLYANCQNSSSFKTIVADDHNFVRKD